MIVQVETDAQHSAKKEPIHFFLGLRRIAVVDIVDRWPTIDYTYFKVQADDGNTYILKYDGNADQWEMTFFQAGYQI